MHALPTGDPHTSSPTSLTTHHYKKLPSEPSLVQQFQNFVLGGSILRNIEPHILNGELTNLITIVDFILGAQISDISKRISDVAKHTPKHSVLNIGSNNINQAKNPNQVMV